MDAVQASKMNLDDILTAIREKKILIDNLNSDMQILYARRAELTCPFKVGNVAMQTGIFADGKRYKITRITPTSAGYVIRGIALKKDGSVSKLSAKTLYKPELVSDDDKKSPD